MQCYYNQTKRPEPLPTDNQTLAACADAKANELTATLVDIARAGAGLPPKQAGECSICGRPRVTSDFCQGHFEEWYCQDKKMENFIVSKKAKQPVLSPAARAARAHIILAVYDYTQERDRVPRDYRSLAEAQDNWLKVLDRELAGLEAPRC